MRRMLVVLLALVGACRADPQPRGLDAALDRGPGRDAASSCVLPWSPPLVGGDALACTRASTDYRPGVDDSWPPCVSDDNTYHPFQVSIGSVARVAAFEQIRAQLLHGSVPTPDQFLAARLAYATAEGLDSRVSRREDEHYPAPAKKCADMGSAELALNADRCVGPAQMLPILNAAFADGARGLDALGNAARIEATLLWFLYLSTYKEALTCTTNKPDCDSAWAYYTGGEVRASGKGLSKDTRALSPQAHDHIWDGLLAVRCWRDLDGEVLASRFDLRDRALAQLDRGLLRGYALLVKARFLALGNSASASCPTARAAQWSGLQILGRALLREAEKRLPTQAAILRAELARSKIEEVKVSAATSALDAIFPCP